MLVTKYKGNGLRQIKFVQAYRLRIHVGSENPEAISAKPREAFINTAMMVDIDPLPCAGTALFTKMREGLPAIINSVNITHSYGVAGPDNRTNVMWIVDIFENNGKCWLTLPEGPSELFGALRCY
ncbi:MAG: hypothetical protein OKBPIBMD_01783 [Chlorobi bacterium]|nr:MAG: hypothetical protein UZ06_CHB003000179 [Chlorobi bacterium OLB6]MBV6464328.1 hypothetical protein [Chlorobiota bacterium]